jgi:glycosyltransferase involved in cell wall biosynthesis
MRRVLHVLNTYFALPYFIGEQFNYFRNKGCDFCVICSPSPYLKPYALKMGFKYKEVEIARTITPLKDFKAFIQICRYINKNKIDTVIGHTPKGGLVSMLAAFIMRVPKRIFFRHGLAYETASGIKRQLLLNAERLTAFCATEVVCVSPSIYNLSIKDRLNSQKKQLTLGKGTCGGIDTINKFNPAKISSIKVEALRNKLGISDNAFVIGFCGRLIKDKGIQELVEGFDIIRSHYSEKVFRLLLVGMFEERDALPEHIIKRIYEDHGIVYTGFINDSIEYYYSLMNVDVLASYREGFGMSVIEASAMEIPVLTSRSTGCIDSIIEGSTGRYIEITPSSIAEGIELYLNNPEQARTYGKNGREFVKRNFDNLIIWKELEQFYS